MPGFLTFLGVVGTAAMIWVGGSIIVHSLETYDLHFVAHAISSVAEVAARPLPVGAIVTQWVVETLFAGTVGLLIGAISIAAIGFAITPAWKLARRAWDERS
jgi:predicted DNA repair protein MutK